MAPAHVKAWLSDGLCGVGVAASALPIEQETEKIKGVGGGARETLAITTKPHRSNLGPWSDAFPVLLCACALCI